MLTKFPISRWAQGFALLLLLGWAAPVWAEDTGSKWQFGFGISYWSTDDSIRSNAGTAYAPADPSQGTSLPPIKFSDPRPDANEVEEASIEDSFKLDFNASYGFTRWFAVEIGMSYFRGDVGNLEIYVEERTVPISLPNHPYDPNVPADAGCFDAQANPGGSPCFDIVEQDEIPRNYNTRFPVGEITEVPVTLSGLVRFRPESPFDPYIGAGVGYIFTSIDTSSSQFNSPIIITSTGSNGETQASTLNSFQDLQDFTSVIDVRLLQSGARGVVTWPTLTSTGPTKIAPLSVEVNDGFAWHLQGGVDYYFNERWSLFIDGKYVWADSTVKARINNETQVLANIPDFGCQNNSPTCQTVSGPVAVGSVGGTLFPNESVDDTSDLVLIQGGDIRLGGFSLGFGVKITF